MFTQPALNSLAFASSLGGEVNVKEIGKVKNIGTIAEQSVWQDNERIREDIELESITKVKDDTRFLGKLLRIIKFSNSASDCQHIFSSPVIKARLKTLNSEYGALSEQLKLLINFLQERASLLKSPFVEVFIASQLVRLQTSLDIKSLCKKQVIFCHDIFLDYSDDDEYKKKLMQLIYSFSLPLSVKDPLKIILNHVKQRNANYKTEIPSTRAALSSSNEKLNCPTYYASRNDKIFAVSVASQIDGYEHKSEGLRAWIHCPPRGKGNRAPDLIIKDIEEFRTGKRNFIFECSQTPVPLENYKEVMLYIICSLKQDRAIYYQNHPGYIEDDLYQQCAAKLDKGEAISLEIHDCYSFEWAARKLIELEEKIRTAKTDKEMSICLSEFRNYYYRLANFNIDLTVCSCIDARVFSLEWNYKPVIYHGVPPLLIELAQRVGIWANNSKENVTSLIGNLVSKINFHPQKIQNSLNELSDIYSRLIENPKDKMLMEQFLSLWALIPFKKAFFKSSYGEDKLSSSFKQILTALESHVGVSEERFNHLQEIKSQGSRILSLFPSPLDKRINQMDKEYSNLFYSPIFDPQSTLVALRSLKKDIDTIKIEHAQEILKRGHWIQKFSANLNSLLQESPQDFFEVPRVNFKEVADRVKRCILFPIPGLKEKMDAFIKVLSDKHSTPMLHLEQVLDCLLDLKMYLTREAIHFPNLSYGSIDAIVYALHVLEKFEIDILEEAMEQKEHSSVEVLRFISRIAIASGILEEEIVDLSLLEKKLEEVKKKRLKGYQGQRCFIANNSSLLDLLYKSNCTIDEAIQVIQGGLNTGFFALLDKFLFNKNSIQSTLSNLSGRATKFVNVLGKLRFIPNGEEVAAAKEGEILVIENASSEVHQYANASAIISHQGGIFSHAAITFSDLNIPSLLGCDTQLLKAYDGQLVYLQLSHSSSLTPMSNELVGILEKMQQLTLETAAIISSLSGGIKQIVSSQFYRAVFNRLSPKEIFPFLIYPEAQVHFKNEIKAIQMLEQQLWSSENLLERGYLIDKIEKKRNRLWEIAKDRDSQIAEEVVQEQMNFQRRISPLVFQRNAFPKNSGKKENLDGLQQILPHLSLPSLQLNIPPYQSFTAQELIWSIYPDAKKQIEAILHSSLKIADKSHQIRQIILQLPLDQAELLKRITVEGQLIVRSSARLEDQTNQAAAGIFESVVIKDQSELSQAFLQVLASAFSEKALAFFKEEEITNGALFDMIWIVQHYVTESQYSGVAFSIANEKEWEIAAMQLVKGSGGGVEGKEIPAQIFVDTRYQIFTDLHLKKGEQLPCSVEILKEIAFLMKQLETHFKAPVEIEFVVKDHQLSLVQLRPITIK